MNLMLSDADRTRRWIVAQRQHGVIDAQSVTAVAQLENNLFDAALLRVSLDDRD
jgi:hypothetical protein